MSQSPEERIPEDEDNVEAPLTMAASVLLSNLPKDTSKALETAGTLSVEKGQCRHLSHRSHCLPVSSSVFTLMFYPFLAGLCSEYIKHA